MSVNSESVLVYDRIDINRQNTRLLMATFVLFLLPLAAGLAQYLTPESVFQGSVSGDQLNPTPSQIWDELITTVTVLVAIAAATAFVALAFSSSLLLQHMGADAVLLTRDPDGLALALAKVGKAVAPGMKAGAASAHLYFVDPLPRTTSLWGHLYAVHPPIADRIARIATMGDGVPPDELKAAEQAGSEYADRLYGGSAGTRQQTGSRSAVVDPSVAELADAVPGTKFRLTQTATPLYQAADGWSRVIERLREGAVLEVIGSEANFVRVTVEGVRGYVSRGAPATRFHDLTRNG
jgi:hypothetical protein